VASKRSFSILWLIDRDIVVDGWISFAVAGVVCRTRWWGIGPGVDIPVILTPHFAARGKDERSKLSPVSFYSYSITNYVFIYRFHNHPISTILIKRQMKIDTGIRLHNVMKLLAQRCNFKFAERDIYNLC